MSNPVYTNSIFKVSVLANAVPGFAVSGASIPGMPPQPPSPDDPGAAFPGPAWQAQFRHTAKPAVLYDTAPYVPPPPPGPVVGQSQAFHAKPGQAWRNQFGPLSRSSKNPVLFDLFQLSFGGLYNNPSGDLGFSAPNTAGYAFALPASPSSVIPSPAWQNQFLKWRSEKNVVLFDQQLNNAGSSSAAIAFGATSQALVFIPVNDPSQVLPSPAWQNQFQYGRLTKNSVLFDLPFALSGNYLNITGDFAFGSVATGSQAFYADPQAILPGPAWKNRFLPRLKRKVPVLFDSQAAIFGPYCFIGTNEALQMEGLGGTATLVSLDASSAGTAVDENQYAGTAVDENAGLAGSEINDISLGGIGTEANAYGGFLYGGCYD